MPLLQHKTMTSKKKTELLAPAGDMERLTMALHYGADAVYLAGRRFGMRAFAGNFDHEEMKEAVRLSHEKGVKAYVTMNTIPSEDELAGLPQFIGEIRDSGADAFIVTDLGVLELCKKHAPDMEIHISTQLGVMNSGTARLLHDLGASRVIIAREMSLSNIKRFRDAIPPELEVEAFVHGAMCVSFSGRCLLSSYMTGRDANKGACAQPCRWKYRLEEAQRPGEYFEISEDGGTHILNAKDMCMIEHLPEIIDAGIDSIKIEGRMKSAYYAAVVTNAYRHALDDAMSGKPLSPVWIQETEKLSHRPYSTGFYFNEPGQHYNDSLYYSDADVCAVVEEEIGNGMYRLSQRNKFSLGEELELLNREGEPVAFIPEEIFNAKGESIESAPHAMMELKMKLPIKAERLSILRKLK